MSASVELNTRQTGQIVGKINKEITNNSVESRSEYNEKIFFEKMKNAKLPGDPLPPEIVFAITCKPVENIDNDHELDLFVKMNSGIVKEGLPDIFVNKTHGDFYVGLIEYAFWNLIDSESKEYLKLVLKLNNNSLNINSHNFSVCNQLSILINTTIHKASLILGNYFGIDAKKCLLRSSNSSDKSEKPEDSDISDSFKSSVISANVPIQNPISGVNNNPNIIYGNGSIFELEDNISIKNRDGGIKQYILTYRKDVTAHVCTQKKEGNSPSLNS